MTDLKSRSTRALDRAIRWRKARGPLAAITVVAILAATAGIVVVFFKTQVGVQDAVQSLPADSIVYDRDGREIADLHPAGATRRPVPLTAVAPNARDAIVAIEDRNFWHEGSTDLPRLVEATVYDVVHHDTAQGGSTITEQLAKVLYLSNSKTFDRKLREIVLGQQLSSQQTKEQILGEYLNDIYFGHGATGIEAASWTYFGVPAAQLDLAESAMLAGLPNQPSNLDPLQHLAAAKGRQRQVLQAMVQARELTQDQADAAYAESLPLADRQPDDLNLYPHLTHRVTQELSARLGVDPERAGLSVQTSIDSGLQDDATGAVRADVDNLRGRNVSDGALISIDPRTGEVLAYVGSAGPNHPGNQYDLAGTPRQPGSTFKVLTYTEAIAERRITPLTPVSDGPLTLPTGGGADGTRPYVVHDFDNRYHGVLTAQEDLGNSFNIPAVRVEEAAGIDSIVNEAHDLGITALDRPAASYGPSLTLGGYPVPLWQLAQAYGAIADGGVLHPVHFVRSAHGPDGREMMPAPDGGRQVIDPAVAYVMNAVLSSDANRALEFGYGSDLVIPGHEVAAKTGTTNDSRDALTVGWTPRFLTAAWVGNADDRPMTGVIGLTGGAPMWHEVMAQGLGQADDGWPAAPPSGVHETSWAGRQAWLLDGTAPGGAVLGGGPFDGLQGEDGTAAVTSGLSRACQALSAAGIDVALCAQDGSGRRRPRG